MESELGIESIDQVKRSAVSSFIASLSELGIQPRTLNRKLSSIQSFFEWAIRNEYIKQNPARGVKRPKTGSALPSVVRIESIDQLFSEIEFPEGFVGLRDRLILNTLYACGLRRQELIDLTIDSINDSDRTIKVKGKRNKERIVPVSVGILELLIEYRKHRAELNPESNHLFITERGKKLYPGLVYNMVKNYLSLVTSMEKRGPHVLRHTYATHLLNEGANLQAIKELLGHESLASTQVYTHTSLEKLKEVYQKHPRHSKS